MELSLLGIRFVLGLVLVTASFPKLADQDDFRRALRNYQLLPFSLVRPVARWLPRLELLVGGLLVGGLATRVVASISAIAFFAFSSAVAINLARGRKIECGCFGGSAPRRITWRLVCQDLTLAAGAVALVADPPPHWAGRESLAVLLVATFVVLLEGLITEWLRLARFDGASSFGGVS